MPRSLRVPLSDALETAGKGHAVPAPAPKRVPMTFRITETAYERLRRMAFETRVSQQARVDQALERFLADSHG